MGLDTQVPKGQLLPARKPVLDEIRAAFQENPVAELWDLPRNKEPSKRLRIPRRMAAGISSSA